MKPKVKMENWARCGVMLVGAVHGHPLFPDGTEVITSAIVSGGEHLIAGDWVETKNTVYKLGKPA